MRCGCCCPQASVPVAPSAGNAGSGTARSTLSTLSTARSGTHDAWVAAHHPGAAAPATSSRAPSATRSQASTPNPDAHPITASTPPLPAPAPSITPLLSGGGGFLDNWLKSFAAQKVGGSGSTAAAVVAPKPVVASRTAWPLPLDGHGEVTLPPGMDWLLATGPGSGVRALRTVAAQRAGKAAPPTGPSGNQVRWRCSCSSA
jgi:hypothetical protein